MKLLRDKIKRDTYMVSKLCGMIARNELRNDHPQQRKSGQWDKNIRDNFIVTVIKNEDFDPIKICEQLTDKGVVLWLIDGLQRSTTIENFKAGRFALGRKIDPCFIEYQEAVKDENGETKYNNVSYDLRGKSYKDLPEKLREDFDNELNKVIQEKLLGDVLQSISGFEMTFKLGAKVMQTVNDYDKNVFNGEIGYITEINERCEGKKKEEYCVVTYTDIFGKDKLIEYTKKELSALDLAYAMTVHKLQGAGRKIVIGIIDNTHHQLLDNCMLYTLLTRAKKRCLLLAEPQAFLQCIRTSHNKRNTWMMLEEKIA